MLSKYWLKEWMNQKYEKDDYSVYFDTVYAGSLGGNEKWTGNNNSDSSVILKRMQICICTKNQWLSIF